MFWFVILFKRSKLWLLNKKIKKVEKRIKKVDKQMVNDNSYSLISEIFLKNKYYYLQQYHCMLVKEYDSGKKYLYYKKYFKY